MLMLAGAPRGGRWPRDLLVVCAAALGALACSPPAETVRDAPADVAADLSRMCGAAPAAQGQRLHLYQMLSCETAEQRYFRRHREHCLTTETGRGILWIMQTSADEWEWVNFESSADRYGADVRDCAALRDLLQSADE